MFTIGVFVSYLLAGLGIYQIIALLDTLPMLRTAIRLAGAGIAVVLGILTMIDVTRAMEDSPNKMILRLPITFVRRVHEQIRTLSGRRFFFAGAFFTGIIVSGVEFICTGQVYLPTILFMRTQSQHAHKAIAYLLLYNLAFVTPMVVVFLAAYFGMSSRRLAAMSRRWLVIVKLSLAVVLLALGIYMLTDVYRGLV